MALAQQPSNIQALTTWPPTSAISSSQPLMSASAMRTTVATDATITPTVLAWLTSTYPA